MSLKYYKRIIGIFVFCSLYFVAMFAFATPPTSPYTAGATLDPACIPGDTNCTVSVLTIGDTIASATAGSVFFAGTAGILSEDNGSFFWDDMNNRLGIGTTTPSTFLHVLGTTEQLRIGYNVSNYASLTVNSGGNLTLAPTGGNLDLTGRIKLNTTQALYLPGGNFTGTMVIGDGGTNLSYISGNNGKYNTFIGLGSGNANTTGYSNVANGYQALYSNTTGYNNTANGYQSFYSNTNGDSNVATGYQTLYSNTSGYGNIASGFKALYSNTSGALNTANGYYALYSNTTGSSNVANGSQALYSNTTGSSNVANGSQALYSNTTGYQNTANGLQALYSNTTGYLNVANGSRALYSNTTGFENIANGALTLYLNTTGFYNIAIGTQALNSNTTGSYNIANGYNTLLSNTTGSYNIANGFQALLSNTTGSYNIANGYQALYSSNGDYNVANGYQALYGNSTGSNNVANGYQALHGNSTGSNNVANGYQALQFNGTSVNNTANGYRALYSNTTGFDNTAIGYQAGAYRAGGVVSNSTSNTSVYLGSDTKSLADGDTNEIVIGYNTTGIGSNSVTLGNDSITKTALKGSVGIGTTSPGYKFDVQIDSASTYVANFFNDGNNDNRWGIVIQAGADTPSANKWIQFKDGDGTDQGSICYTGGQANVCAPSDERLKKNIVDTTLSLDTLMGIKVRDFSYISDSQNRIVHGFVAQELNMVYPDAVSVPVDPIESWKVSYAQLTPLIIKSIQELSHRFSSFLSLDAGRERTLGWFIREYLENTANGLRKIFAKEIYTEKLCVGNTCVTEAELIQLLQKNDQSPNTNPITEENIEPISQLQIVNTIEHGIEEENTDSQIQEEKLVTETEPAKAQESTTPASDAN